MLENSFDDSKEIKEFSVSEISSKVKGLLENNLGKVRVKGEISGLKIASSGHGYFNLKDSFSVLACICWRPTISKTQFPLKDGLEIVAIGKITSYAVGNSRYQLSAEKIELSGIGAMIQILNERKIRLETEGLFDIARKKNLPFLPNRIGVITSITGAVIKDIIHRINDRFPTNILIWPVLVQGETAAEEVASAITGFNNINQHYRPDVLIIARGGGSIEDLWPFNEEVVVRSTAASKIPIISAVGHETDYTLIDLAADVRAPTPTAAAEFAVPVAANLKYTINLYYDKISSYVVELTKYKRQILNRYSNILKLAENYINFLEQRLDELSFRLVAALPNLMKSKTRNLESLTIERLDPHKIVSYKSIELIHLSQNLMKSIDKTLKFLDYKLNINDVLLNSLDYNNVLKRGFTIIKNEKGEFLSSKAIANKNDKFNIKFFDGEINVKKS